jgi:integrase
MKVSRPVHLEVSRQVSQSASQIESTDTRQQPSPGRYLVRSGSAYLFQIKVPKEIVTGGPLIRISIGARPHRHARAVADLMAARARVLFNEARRKRVTNIPTGTDPVDSDQLFTGETPEEVVAEMRGALKAYLRMIDRPEDAPTSDELRGTSGIRDLVSLSREIELQKAGQPFSELIVENADLLKQKAFEKLQSSTAHSPQMLAATAPDTDTPTILPQLPVNTGPPVDENGKRIAAFKLDRRTVVRKQSNHHLFSTVAAEYIAMREVAKGVDNKDVRIARARIEIFLELIGDHPVNTYTGTDMQAFVDLMQYWPGDSNVRDPSIPARQTIDDNRDLHLRPLTRKSLQEGYVAAIKAAMRSGLAEHDYQDPFANAKIHYPDTAAAPVAAEPLGAQRISEIFRVGVNSGIMDNAMLPLLGHLTGRRLGLLIHLTGNDFREKFAGVWVAQTAGVAMIKGKWQRIPYKTDASTPYFVLHNFLIEIGFVDWAIGIGDAFIFAELMKLKDPGKSASSYMLRLFKKAGVKPGNREVFHSLRGGNIDDMRDAKVDPRDRKLQAGHQLGSDEHELYGFKALQERQARELARMPLNDDIDFSVFKGLDFQKLAATPRVAGPRSKKK